MALVSSFLEIVLRKNETFSATTHASVTLATPTATAYFDSFTIFAIIGGANAAVLLLVAILFILLRYRALHRTRDARAREEVDDAKTTRTVFSDFICIRLYKKDILT